MPRIRWSEALAPWLSLAVLLALWQLASNLFQIPEFILPSPLAIGATLWQRGDAVLAHALDTLHSTTIGFALAVVVGVVLGALIGSFRLAHRAFYPLMVAFNTTPKVALVPVLVIWFGIGKVPAIITAFAIAFPPVAVNVATGLATMEPELKDVLRALGASRWQIIAKVGLPQSLPYLFGSLKIALSLAFVGAVISETIASNEGIGYLMVTASSRLDVPMVFAGLFVTAGMGVALYAVFAAVEGRVTRWSTLRSG